MRANNDSFSEKVFNSGLMGAIVNYIGFYRYDRG